MRRFRKKPVVIEAVQFTHAVRQAHHFDGGPLPPGVRLESAHIAPSDRVVLHDRFVIDTLEGLMEVSLGDWIIRGVEGELYPCKPGIFAKTYEEVPS